MDQTDYKRPLRPGEHSHQFSQHFYGAPEHVLSYDEDINGSTPITDFDWNAIEGEESTEATVSFSDMSAALSLILGWIQGKNKKVCNANSVASRALGLLYMLDPASSHFSSLDDIGKVCGGMSRGSN